MFSIYSLCKKKTRCNIREIMSIRQLKAPEKVFWKRSYKLNEQRELNFSFKKFIARYLVCPPDDCYASVKPDRSFRLIERCRKSSLKSPPEFAGGDRAKRRRDPLIDRTQELIQVLGQLRKFLRLEGS